MKTSAMTAVLPAQDLDRCEAFYIDRVGLAVTDGALGLTVSDGVNQLFIYPAHARASGEFTQAVIQVTDVPATVGELRERGVLFEEYDTPEIHTNSGIAHTPDGGEAAWFRDSEGNLIAVARALEG